MRSTVAPPPPGELQPGPIPSFSVIIAAYQSAAVIGEAVASALDQRPRPLEVVVCDDGSTDDLAGALAPFGDEVRLVRTEHGGEASAKNHAARQSRGDFVVILDSDDVFLPGRLEALGQLAAARPDLDLLTTDAWLVADGRTLRRCYTPEHPFAVEDQRGAILQRNFVFGLAAVRRSRLLGAGGFDEGVRYTTDWECWIRLILDGVRVGLVDEPLARYRLSERSLSAQRLEMARGRLATLGRAASHPGLTAVERRVVADGLQRERRRVAWEELKVALRRRDPRSRAQAWQLATDRGAATRRRLVATLAAAAPGVAGGHLRRAERAHWTGVGDIRVPRRQAPAATG